MRFRVLPEANWDVMEVVEWFVKQGKQTIAKGIWSEWQTGQDAISANPRFFARDEEAPADREIRYVLTRKFSYRIVFEITAEEVIILAFIHTKRLPESWIERLVPG